MEPNRLEQEFREKLEQRTIEPSKMAWDRLDAMLSVSEEKEEQKVVAIRPDRKWMYVAAGFVLFLLAGVLFLRQEKEIGSGTINNGSGFVTKEQPARKESTTAPAQTEEHNATQNISVPQNTENTVATTGIIKRPSKGIVQQQNSNPAGSIKEKSNVAQSNNEGVAIISNEGTKAGINFPVANEADKLLAVSGGDIHKKKKSIRVDANSLLSSVEGELDESFRDKALQGVVKNFNTVKSSVANRNYQ